tara:strand:- start:212 stop:430 length:219 start_codon:yes stop_codon:yes gene_type:complete
MPTATERGMPLEERLFTLVSRALLAITLFLLTTLWAKVDRLDEQTRARDRDLAEFMLEIEHRMTALEVRNED